MKLTVLGSGVAISDWDRAASGFILEFNNSAIAIDLGFGCFKNMQKAGIDYNKVNDLFFTHFEHPDHVNDLIAFLMARKVAVDQRISKPTQINLFGGNGFRDFTSNLCKAFPFFDALPFKLNATELPEFGTKKFPRFSLTTKPMAHVKSSLGYRFGVGKKTIAFSGDTGLNENLVDLAKDTDLLVAECSNFFKEVSGHLSIAQISQLVNRAKPKAVLLTHFYQDAEKADLKKELSKTFKGKIFAAKDLMEVNI